MQTVGGELDTSFGLGSFFGVNSTAALIFDANDDCILESAVFYAQYQNSIKFEVRDSLGQIIDDTTHAVYPGKQRLTLNFEIPAGQSMRLGIGTQGSFLYRNRANTSYPYNIGNLVTIKTSNSSWWPNQYYYFYYDMIFQKNCEISESYNCVNVNDCQDPGDGSGQYSTLADCINACVSSYVNETKEKLNIYPNPAKNHLTIDYSNKNNYSMSIYSLSGSLIKKYKFAESLNYISIEDLYSGYYFVEILCDEKTQRKKLIIE